MCCIAGVIFVKQPWNIDDSNPTSTATYNDSNSIPNYKDSNLTLNQTHNASTVTPIPTSNDFIVLGEVMSVIAGLCTMCHFALISHYEYLRDSEVRKSVIFWMLLLGAGLSFCISISGINGNLVMPGSFKDWLFIFGDGITYAMITPLEMYIAGSILPGVVNSVIGSTSIIFLFPAQYTFLPHSGHENWVEIFGVVIVVLSSIFPIVVKTVNEKGDYLRKVVKKFYEGSKRVFLRTNLFSPILPWNLSCSHINILEKKTLDNFISPA